MATIANWYHCPIKPIGRSAGRSAVAAAAYRLGERLHDERYATLHDYTRRSGVEATFTMAPADAPAWALDPEQLWNAAERAEKKSNSRLAREAEIALPAFVTPEDRLDIVKAFAEALIDRYGVAVSAALHEPGKGDQRNYHCHVMFTTRSVTAEGLGQKTRVLDDLKTGPVEIEALRKLAADIINAKLEAINSDIRITHLSYEARGIEQEPTTHLGYAASEMERRGEPSDRGELNRQAEQINAMIAERNAVDSSIAEHQERQASPPRDREEALERMRDDGAGLAGTIHHPQASPGIEQDGLSWWQRVAVRVQERARDFALSVTQKLGQYWQAWQRDREPDADRGMDR